jgi:hypothetical protein
MIAAGEEEPEVMDSLSDVDVGIIQNAEEEVAGFAPVVASEEGDGAVVVGVAEFSAEQLGFLVHFKCGAEVAVVEVGVAAVFDDFGIGGIGKQCDLEFSKRVLIFALGEGAKAVEVGLVGFQEVVSAGRTKVAFLGKFSLAGGTPHEIEPLLRKGTWELDRGWGTWMKWPDVAKGVRVGS